MKLLLHVTEIASKVVANKVLYTNRRETGDTIPIAQEDCCVSDLVVGVDLS